MNTRAVITFPMPATTDPLTPMVVADLIASRLFNGRPTNSISLNRQDVKDLLLCAMKAVAQ